MKFCLNSDDLNYASLWHYNRLLTQMDLLDETSEVALNICSISNKGMVRKKCTVYIEGDDFGIKGTNKHLYDQADIIYTYAKKYLKYYPEGTKLITGYFDPEWHYPRDVKKDHDFSFIASLRGDPVYDNRKEVIKKLQESKFSFLIKECSQTEYPEQLSRGRIILNILPRRGEDASPNNRVFEGIACGTLMNDRDEVLDDLGLIPNVHYLPLERFGEDFSDEELHRIHEQGRKFIVDRYSYQGAIQSIISDVEEFLAKK